MDKKFSYNEITASEIREIIESQYGSMRAFCEAKGISIQNLSNKLKVMSPKFLRQLRDLGVIPDQPHLTINKGITINNVSDETKEIKAELERLKLENMYLKEIKELMQQKIDKLEKRG